MCEPANWSREPIFASHCYTKEFKNLIQSESPTWEKFCLFSSVHSFRCEWNFEFPLRNADYENWLTSKYKQGNVVRRNWEQRHLRFICFFCLPDCPQFCLLGNQAFISSPLKSIEGLHDYLFQTIQKFGDKTLTHLPGLVKVSTIHSAGKKSQLPRLARVNLCT